MPKYAAPNVVYRGYIVTMDRYTDMMKRIPEFQDLMQNAGYGEDDPILCYAHWKILVLNEKLRSRSPKIKRHWESGVPTSEPATHMMILTSFLRFPEFRTMERAVA